VSSEQQPQREADISLIEIGPVSMRLLAERGGLPLQFSGPDVEEYVSELLSQITNVLPVLKQKAWRIKNPASLPEVAQAMLGAVRAVSEETLTPMAAVAGAIADAVRARLSLHEPDYLSVNNGGDISVLNLRGRPVRIGIGDINRGAVPHTMKIDNLSHFGLATSGFGGRSFTLGLADMVSVVAPTGALADAAATHICNHTRIDSLDVTRRPAREIDPLTDIPDELVTVRIGRLSGGEITEALAAGKRAADRLKSQGIILDAVIVLRDKMVTTINGGGNVQLEVLDGD
jgi:ApbE superfamily uncharacterized protein (UPF0280 family)